MASETILCVHSYKLAKRVTELDLSQDHQEEAVEVKYYLTATCIMDWVTSQLYYRLA